MDSLQAQITECRTQGDAVRAITRAEKLNINSNSPLILDDSVWVKILSKRQGVGVRIVKNLSVGILYILLGVDASALTDKSNYHYILHAGDAERDGKGEALDLSWWQGDVWAFMEVSGTGYVGLIEATGTPE